MTQMIRRFCQVLWPFAAGAAAVLLLWQLPQWQTGPWRAFLTPKDLLQLQNEIRQTLLLLLGGAVLLGTLGVLWRRVVASERTALQSLALAQESQQLERYSRAVGQLADERLEVRLGAIYGLERVATESASQHGPVRQVLAAYVRGRAAWNPERPQQKLPIDVRAALGVLGRGDLGSDDGRLDLRGVDLRGADLDGLHLPRAILIDAHVEGASLQGVQLAGADLRAAHLSNADLVEANLKGADLREAHLEAAYLVEARLEGADLGGAFMAGAYLGGAHLEGADLGGAQLDGAYLYKAHLEGASLHAARVVSSIGMHRDERERINRTAAAMAAEPAPPRPAPRPLRKPAAPAAAGETPREVSLRRSGRA